MTTRAASDRRESQIILSERAWLDEEPERSQPNLASRRPEVPEVEGPFAGVVAALSAAAELSFGRPAPVALPSRTVVAAIVEDLRAVLYPAHFGGSDGVGHGLRHRIGTRLRQVERSLREQVRRGLGFACEHPSEGQCCDACEEQADDITAAFILRLPAIRALLDTDVQAAFAGDPAARSPDETLFCYPGVTAMIQHRIAHALHRLKVPLIPRIVSEIAHSATGIDIHPGAEIGSSFFIDHGTGVVIGETCTIGERVRLYQGVTLGARGFPVDDQGQLLKGLPRHPIVEDDVVIYAGATILGRITIGQGATIGGNVWLTRSVPAGGFVTQARARRDSFENGSGI